MRGVIKKEILGKERNFHFGTQMFMLCEDEGVNVGELSESLKNRIFNSMVIVGFCAARAYCMINKTKEDFTKLDVSLWVDEIGVEDFMNMILEGLKTAESKNPKALETQGITGESTNT